MNILKQQALDKEDYTLAEQIRNKMNIIQLQMEKMQDQFSTDILQNAISQWQLELIHLINTTSSNKLSEINILTCEFHVSFLNLIKGIPLGFYESLIRALLILFPHDLPDFPKSPYGWEFFARKVNVSVLRNQEAADIVKTLVILGIMDIISIAIGGSTNDHVRKETYDLALRHIFHYLHTLAIRKVMDFEGPLVDKAFTRCAVTVGYISQYSNKDIFRHVMHNFDPARKVPAEEMVLCLSVLRYSFGYPPKEQQVLEAVDYIKELIVICDKTKKVAVKNAIIQLLERIVQPHQTEGSRKPEETLIWPEIAILYKKARKWSSVDDLKESSLHLMTVILVNSRIDFFGSNIDSFLNIELCPKLKVRPYAYRCLLQLLRGKYYQDTLKNYEDAIRGVYITGRHFSHLTRAANEQSFGVVSNRLNAISEMMFFRRKLPIPEEFLDLSASVVVQIAAHSITIGAKLISQLLDTTRVDHSAESYYIGLRSLRIILDRDSGFQKYAASKVDPEFDMIVKDFPYDIIPSISSIYDYMESKIGVAVLGPNAKTIEMPDFESIKPFQVDPDASAASAMKILNQSMSNLVIDDGEEVSVGPSSPNRKSKLEAAPSSPTLLRRGSLLSSLPNLLAVQSMNDLLAEDTDSSSDYISETVVGWFQAVGTRGKNVDKYSVESALVDKARLKKLKSLKLTPEQKQAVNLLQELILIIQFVPSPEFIGGNFFIGGFLAFYRDDIANDVALALINIFKGFPDLRLGIINGFINFLKTTKIRDDITMSTNLLVLRKLIQTWVEVFDESQSALIPVESFYRVSCKLDACMLYLMCHANGMIRSTCLQIVLELYKLQKSFLPHGTKPGEMPLAYILFTSEALIVKQAIYAFLESSSRGHNLSAKIASSLHPLTLLEVASSSFTGLFQYYHGELVKRFSFCGRPKAIRHLAKYLRTFAPTMIHENPTNPTQDYIMFFGSNMILLMAMAGVPLSSEVEYTHRPKSLEESKHLLFSSFRGLIPYLLTLDKGWEAKAIFRAFYFLHRDVIGLFVSELNQNFEEVRHNSNVVMNTRLLDNVFFMLRYLIQYPHFELLLEESAVHSQSLIIMYADFIAFTSLAAFGDTSFLIEGPAVRIKTATNFCIITQRLCYCLHVVRKKLLRQGRFDGNMAPFQQFETTLWPSNLRKNAVIQMKEWYDAIRGSAVVPQSPKITISDSVDPRKLNNLKTKLLVKIGLAMEKVMELGGVFTSNPLPIGLLPWMATLQGEGFKVFTPDFLLSFEDALGTTLASSYSGQGSIPISFCDAIFEQLLPKLDDGPHVYLFGNSRRMSFAESFVGAAHSLPPSDPAELTGPSFIYPEIRQEDISKLKQHVGSLLFYGLYNLMHSNGEIRTKSLVFIRELIQMFNPDEENFDVQNNLLPFIGGFYSGVGSFLKEKILHLSTICSELFVGHSGSFLWEAVRCARSIQISGKRQLLVNPRSWIIELMIPWCQFVDLGAINVDMVNAEFFRFLMDSAFDDPAHNEDIVNCWGEVAKSPEFGAVNAAVLMDVVIGVCARFPVLESAAFTMASTLANIQPDLVATVLTYHLSSAAFPWNQSKVNQSFQHTSQLAIKDYISSLYQTFKTTQPESQNDYRINCQSAAAISAVILPQQFKSFSPYLALLINYLLVHLNGPLVYQKLLTGLIHGFISYLHQTDEINSHVYENIQDHLRKILGWFEMADPKVVWAKSKDLPTNGFQVTEIPMDEFAERVIALFETHNPSVRMELIEEVINWAAEGFLGHVETLHAIKSYQYYLTRETEIPVKLQDLLLSRLLDQVSVLSQLELEAKTIRNPDKDLSGWGGLPQGKLSLRNDSVEVINSLLELHRLFLVKFDRNGSIESHGKLFWVNMGLLHLSSQDFGDTVSKALDNILFVFEHLDRAKLDNYFLYPLDSKDGRSCDIQSMLIPHIFGSNSAIQDKAILVLLNSWIVFPAVSVDANKTAHLYSILYTITWIFVRISQRQLNDHFLTALNKLEQVLLIYFPTEIEDLQIGINRLKEIVISNSTIPFEAQQILFKQCTSAIFVYFIKEFGNNIAQYLAQIISINTTYQQVGLKMAHLLWSTTQELKIDLNNFHQIKVLIKGIPFIKENSVYRDDLILLIFKQSFEIKDVDVASQGRFEPLAPFECSTGSVRAAWNWIHTDLGIQPSNRMYGLM